MELVALLAFIVIIWIGYAAGNSAVEDESDQTTVYVDQITNVCQISTGPVEAVLIRQSGNEYRDLGTFADAHAAIAEVLKSFRRAKIDAVRIQRNTPSELKIYRLFHSHRGKAEGKKLGGAVIRSLA